jgi:hypothetical protein
MVSGGRARALKLHSTLAFGLSVCATGFGVELTRALAGHFIAWAYVFEWPLFGIVGCHFWWRLVHEDDEAATVRPDAAIPRQAETSISAPDDELAAWQAYVARLQSGAPEADADRRQHPTSGTG